MFLAPLLHALNRFGDPIYVCVCVYIYIYIYIYVYIYIYIYVKYIYLTGGKLLFNNVIFFLPYIPNIFIKSIRSS